MSYQVLARKWRPQTFSQVIGQEHVLAALANGLKLGRIHHAYLFSGTRGVGKTSIARLLAKGLNCETGITDTPCGKCNHCIEIEQGRFVDLLEIDAASRTKVEDTRELLDNVQYAPVQGRFKVYLIDEVHMLSRHSFNALLKTLEEPPEHVKFLLATTDPQKLPITILSRCLQFNLRAMDISQISMQLERILTTEQVSFEPKALQLLGKAADGSMRDALSLTDQAIASGNNNVTAEVVIQMLGMLDDEQPMAIVEGIIRGHTETVFEQIQLVKEKGGAWSEVLIDVASLFHQIALLQLLPNAIEDHNKHHEARLRDLARLVTPTDLQIFYQIMLVGRKELAFAPDAKMGVEMTLLRALAFHPQKATYTQISTASNSPQISPISPSPVQHTSTTQPIINTQAPNSPQTKTLVNSNQTHTQQQQPNQDTFKATNVPKTHNTEVAHSQVVQPDTMTPTEDFVSPARLSVPESQLVAHPIQATTDMIAPQAEQSSPMSPEAQTQSMPTPIQNPSGITQSSPTAHLLKAREMLKKSQGPSEPKKSETAEPTVQPVVTVLNNAIIQTTPETQQIADISAHKVSVANANTTSEETIIKPDATVNIAETKQEIATQLVVEAQSEIVDLKSDAQARETISLEDKLKQHAQLIKNAIDSSDEEDDESSDSYQWRAQLISDEFESKGSAKEIKDALEIEKTPEVQQKLIERAQTRDEWANIIGQLNMPKLVEQLALNCLFNKNGSEIQLGYRSTHKHLSHKGAIQKLTDALTQYYQTPVSLNLYENDDKTKLTPYEHRQVIYQELLTVAKSAIFADNQLQKLCQSFDGKIDEDSIKPI